MHQWTYAVFFDKPDPVNSGDSASWLRYYKMGAGVTSVPLKEESAEAGDTIWFFIDGGCRGGATVRKVEYNVYTDRYEAYYDSDNLLPSGEFPNVPLREISPCY